MQGPRLDHRDAGAKEEGVGMWGGEVHFQLRAGGIGKLVRVLGAAGAKPLTPLQKISSLVGTMSPWGNMYL